MSTKSVEIVDFLASWDDVQKQRDVGAGHRAGEVEAAFSSATGNSLQLYAVGTVAAGWDVSRVADLATLPAHGLLRKTLVADVVKCPTLGATAKQPQTNPLMDNYEGMAIVPGRHASTIELISDDNFGATQITRVLTLSARL